MKLTRGRFILIACIAAALVYVNALWNGFALDDVYIIAGNLRVKNPDSWRAIWLNPYWPTFGIELGLYRPLAISAYALQWWLGDGSPWVFHLGNLLLHVSVTALAFLLLESLTDTKAAFIGALIFAVHPVHTEAVANVIGQAELLAAAAVLGACLVHVRRPREQLALSWPRRAAIALLFVVAMFAKENAVVLPALLVACDAAQRRFSLTWRSIREYAGELIVPLLLLAIVLGAYMTLRYDVLGGHITGTDPGPTLPYLHGDYRLLNALRAFPELVRLMVFPADLVADYSPGVILPVETVSPMVIIGAFLLVGMAGFALITPRRPELGFPAAWFIISIITVSNLIFPIGVLIAERTLYLPSFAFAAAVAYAWQHVLPKASAGARRAAPVLIAGIVIIFAAGTIIRNPDWASTESVHASMIRDHPENYRAQWVQAAAAAAAADPRRALGHYELGYRIYPHDSQFLTDYGLFMLSRSQPEAGLKLLEDAYALNKYVPRTSTFLAYAYLPARRYRDALDMANNANYSGAYIISTLPIVAHAREGLGDRDGAVAAWRALIRLPGGDSFKNRLWLARALALAGHSTEAALAADSAASLGRDSANATLVTRFRAAQSTGCFDGVLPAAQPGCDPLGDYFLVKTSIIPDSLAATERAKRH